ncbi:ribosylnicotinamide kinase [Agyrium rufum]|nr:ribosylnicotinamide kinase [Agyrium rufum]
MSKATIIGLSGCSSSGKTTLARLLRNIFPYTLILHEDDFYLPEEQLLFREGLRDWDCAASIDLPGLVRSLMYIHEHGELPPELVSKEDQNAVGPSGVDDSTIESLKENVRKWLTDEGRSAPLSDSHRLIIMDGFLLLGESVRAVRENLDVKILLRAKYQKAKQRRENRSGYVTLEGFWEDPPDYVDKVVWPNYVEEHAFLFENGDVEGSVKEGLASELGVVVCPGEGEWPMGKVLLWAVENVKAALLKQA